MGDSDRKSKWDVPDDLPKATTAEEKRRLAMAKLSELNAMYCGEKKATNFFEREIDINDSPARFILTKGATQQEIARVTGATVISRGMYRAPNAPPVGQGASLDERRLHLYITSHAQSEFDAAIQKVNEIMSRTDEMPIPYEKLYCIGLESFPPQMIISKLMGPQGSFIQHIESATGAKIEIRGIGTGKEESMEPLHFWVSCRTKEGMAKALQLGRSLIDTITKELLPQGVFPQQPQAPFAPPPPHPLQQGQYPPAPGSQPQPPFAPPPPLPQQQQQQQHSQQQQGQFVPPPPPQQQQQGPFAPPPPPQQQQGPFAPPPQQQGPFAPPPPPQQGQFVPPYPPPQGPPGPPYTHPPPPHGGPLAPPPIPHIPMHVVPPVQLNSLDGKPTPPSFVPPGTFSFSEEQEKRYLKMMEELGAYKSEQIS